MRITTRCAFITTLAVVRIPFSSTATPEPTRVRVRRSRPRGPAFGGNVRCANTVTTAGRARCAIWSMSVCSADKAPCAWDPPAINTRASATPPQPSQRRDTILVSS